MEEIVTELDHQANVSPWKDLETERGMDLTGYFFENVIWGDGAFVETADGFEDYPRAIRAKLRRETTKQLASLR